jgi:SAM-dependent methyltransferase
VSLPGAEFDRLYAASPDPWGIDQGWYERRKRAVVMAALPDERAARAYEPGCGTGALSVWLAQRCDSLLCTDVAEAAVERARERLDGRPGVRVARAVVPDEWPAGPFDLVVVSELAYYLDAAGRDRLWTAATASLRPGGSLLAVHWTRAAPEYPVEGTQVHLELCARPDLGVLVTHVERDFRLDVLARTPPAPASVAERTGLR